MRETVISQNGVGIVPVSIVTYHLITINNMQSFS